MGKQLQLTIFEQAIKLNQLGFDWNTELAFNNIGESNPRYKYENKFPNSGEWYPRPTVTLALKWLRDEKNFNIRAACNNLNCYFPIIEKILEDGTEGLGNPYIKFESHEQAESAGLDFVLDFLINKLKYNDNSDSKR